MITQEDIQNLTGATAYDQAGQKIGQVTAVYQDQATGEPEWLTVKTGLFGRKETFAPLALTSVRGADEVELAADKDTITSAPKIDPDGQLSQDEERQLYSHYGLGYSEMHSPVGLPEATGPVLPEATGPATSVGSEAADAQGHDISGPTTDEAMTRSEERMRVGKATEETGRVRPRKYVVTETVTHQVPVSHEEVRVEREPITGANVGQAMAGPEISEEEHEVTLHAERPVVEKETVPVERVRLAKEQVTGEETVTGEVRKEQIETDADGETDAGGEPGTAR
jgi:uncharacterized protein (TIGR02271 family)